VNLHTAWLAEEGRNKEPKDEQEARHKPQVGLQTMDEEVYQQPYRYTYKTRYGDDDVALFINLHRYISFRLSFTSNER
jgi:hypothetical protein